jgi:GNAT superfamily N-acetyltransferase
MANIPKRTDEILEEQGDRVRIIANTGPMRYKTGGLFSGLLVEAMLGDERIGYFTAEKQTSGNYIMDGVYVEPDYRNNGIATEMLRKAHATVNLTPYSLTDNQIYQSEAGKRLIDKETRMFTASTLVTAGPLLALPEIAAVAGEAAGGAEAAGAAGSGASNVGKALKALNAVSQIAPSGSSSDGGTQNGTNEEPPTSSQDFATPANPVVGSFKVVSFMPTPTVPMKTPLTMPQPSTSGNHPGYNVNQTETKTENKPELLREDNTLTKQKETEPKETEPKPEESPEKIKDFSLELNFTKPISYFNNPAHPRTSSISSNKLFDLLIEDQSRITNNQKITTWE